MPTHHQSPTKRCMLDEPFPLKRSALSLRQCGQDGLKDALLARRDALAICTKGVEHTGIEPGFAPHDTAAAPAVHLAQRGQSERPSVRQESLPPAPGRVRQVVVFGIGIRAQPQGDGGIVEHSQSAMALDGSGLDGAETAGEDVSEGIVEGKRTAILQDKSVECPPGLARFKAQAFHGQLAQAVTQRGA